MDSPDGWKRVANTLSRLNVHLSSISGDIQDGKAASDKIRPVHREVTSARTDVENLRRQLLPYKGMDAHVTTLRQTVTALDTVRERLETVRHLISDYERDISENRRVSKARLDQLAAARTGTIRALDDLSDRIASVVKVAPPTRPQARRTRGVEIRERIENWDRPR